VECGGTESAGSIFPAGEAIDMTDVFSGAVTGTGSGSLGGVDASYTVKDAVTVDITFNSDLHFTGTVVQNVITTTKVTQDGKTSTSVFAKSLISDVSGQEGAGKPFFPLFSVATPIGANGSETLYFGFGRPTRVAEMFVSTEGNVTVPLGGVLNTGVFFPPELLHELQSITDFFVNAFQIGSANHLQNSASTSTEAPHAGTLALLGNYIASSFLTATGGHGGMLAAQAPQTEPQLVLTHPHR